MKKFTFILLAAAAALLGTRLSAQGKYGKDSAECIKYLSYYQEYYKQKSYKDALPNWRKAFRLCPPTASQNMLIHGSNLMKFAMSGVKDQALLKSMSDTLLKLQDIRAEYYPKYALTAMNNKAMYLAQYEKDPQVLHDNFSQIIARNKGKTTPNVFLLDMNAAIELFKAEKLSAEDVIKVYQNSLAMLQQAKAGEETDKAITDLESLFISSKVASCENLIALFTPRYEAAPNDISTLSNIVQMMGSTEGCQDNELFLKAVTSLHQNQPSASSAYYLYRLHSSRDEVSAAVQYMEEAIGSDSLDTKTKADYCFELATFCVKNGLSGKAFDYARRSADLESSYQGKAYYLIGTIWGSVSCGGNEIAKRSHFWVAVDYLNRARNADPSLAADCAKLIGQYSVYYPQKAEAFMYDLVDGQTYTVSCGGMTATTTVRTQK